MCSLSHTHTHTHTHTHKHTHTHACTQVRLDLVNLPVCGLKMGVAAKWVHGGSFVAWVK